MSDFSFVILNPMDVDGPALPAWVELATALHTLGIDGELLLVPSANGTPNSSSTQPIPATVPVRLIGTDSEFDPTKRLLVGMEAATGSVIVCLRGEELTSVASDTLPGYLSQWRDSDREKKVWQTGKTRACSCSDLDARIANWLAPSSTGVNGSELRSFIISRADFELSRKRFMRWYTTWRFPRVLIDRLKSRFPRAVRFVSFCSVGTSGVMVDLCVFLLALSLGAPAAVATVLAIWLAMTWNFSLNRILTFSGTQESILSSYVRFCLSCSAGGAVNGAVRLTLLSVFAAFADRPAFASLLGVIAGTGLNFALCERFVFRRSESNGTETQRAISAPADDSSDVCSRSHAADHDRVDAVPRLQPAPSFWSGLVAFFAFLGAVSFGVGFIAPPHKPTAAVGNDGARVKPTERANSDAPENAPAATVATSRSSAGVIPRTPLDVSDAAIEERLRQAVNHLASDELEGRGVRTHGIDLAADFIAESFHNAGLEADAYNGKAFHEFELYSLGRERVVQAVQFKSNKKLPDVEHEWVLDRDYTSLLTGKSSNEFELPLAFVGFGLTIPELEYDDFAKIDVSGKAVVVLRNFPPHVAKSGDRLMEHAFIRTKVANAAAHDAAAVIFCTDLGGLFTADGAGEEPRLETLLHADLTDDVPDQRIPVIHVQRALLTNWLNSVGFDLAAAEHAIEKNAAPQSRSLEGLRFGGQSSQARVGRRLKNVIGMLPGSGAKAEETVIVGAHYDHLGRGGWGSLSTAIEDEIHNGADDNASGTAILMEAARQLAARPEPLARRVMFIAFSGEELGLIGSKRYVRDPLIPLSKTVAMLNLDMVGRLRNEKLTVYGVETSGVWRPLLESADDRSSLSLSLRAGGFGPSDHASFYEKGIPVLHFFTGFHPQYHRPGDDVELLNIEGMRQITQLITELVVGLTNPELYPQRQQAGPAVADVAPVAIDDVLTGNITPGERPTMLGVVLGPVQEGSGVLIERTVLGTPAAKYGLRAGDVILEVDGADVKGPDDVIVRVRAKKPKQSLSLLILRNGVRLDVQIRL